MVMAIKLSHTQRFVEKKVWAVHRRSHPGSIVTIGHAKSRRWANGRGMSPQALRPLREEIYATLAMVAGPNASHIEKYFQDLTGSLG